MTNKCRICLDSKRNLCSIFETEQGLSYASMIALITGAKVVQYETELICLLCRRKLRDFYEFKLLIERSDVELSKQSKIFKFNTIDDIKVEFESQLNHIELKNVASQYSNLFQNKNECTYYNGTFIRRQIKQEKKTVQMEAPHNTIKSEGPNEDVYGGDYVENASMDKGYNYQRKKKISTKSKKSKTSNKTMRPFKCVNNICIKPMLLNDLRVLKTVLKCGVKKRKSNFKASKDTLCPFCGKICKNIKTHILTHTDEKKIKCLKCPRLFRTKANLYYHMKSHSTIKEIYKCEHCIGTFTSKGSVIKHMASHMQIKQFSCTICKKEFKWKFGLQRHMVIHNMSARSIQCDVCNMSFNNNGSLKAHTRVHTGERPYKCELCSQPYSYKRDFNRHCLKKHGIIIDRRPVYVMNDEVLKIEKALMKDLMLHLHGIPTESEPMDSFQGPQKALAFAKAVKVMQNGQIPIDVHL